MFYALKIDTHKVDYVLKTVNQWHLSLKNGCWGGWLFETVLALALYPFYEMEYNSMSHIFTYHDAQMFHERIIELTVKLNLLFSFEANFKL